MNVCLFDGMYVWVWKFVGLDVCVCLDVCMLARLDVYVRISGCLTACMCRYVSLCVDVCVSISIIPHGGSMFI